MIITKLSKRVPYPFIITIVTEKYIQFQSDNCYKSFVLHAYLINIYIFLGKHIPSKLMISMVRLNSSSRFKRFDSFLKQLNELILESFLHRSTMTNSS